MHENNLDDLPEAEVAEGRKGISVVWLLPLVAVLIGAWLVYKTFSETGPTITIQFDTAARANVFVGIFVHEFRGRCTTRCTPVSPTNMWCASSVSMKRVVRDNGSKPLSAKASN